MCVYIMYVLVLISSKLRINSIRFSLCGSDPHDKHYKNKDQLLILNARSFLQQKQQNEKPVPC